MPWGHIRANLAESLTQPTRNASDSASAVWSTPVHGGHHDSSSDAAQADGRAVTTTLLR